jgi:hypothetical protein
MVSRVWDEAQQGLNLKIPREEASTLDDMRAFRMTVRIGAAATPLEQRPGK